jgi:FKBP-type peptidyl-prolyl cis-trans isomerase FkpA/FKBP-type peptidyl-prolyl cis-trans isomerase FklB
MKKTILALILALSLPLLSATAADEKAPAETKDAKPRVKLETDMDRISYVLGVNIGQDLKQMNVDVNAEAMAQAISDVIKGEKFALSDEEMTKAMQAFQEKMREAQVKQQEEAMKAGEKNTEEGKLFLEANGKKEGVKTTASGLQYQVVKEGSGAQPLASDTVKVNYRGTFINGEEFDSSYKRNEPAQFPLGGVIAGWTEGLQLMKVGSTYKFFVPSDLAYGPQGRGGIPPNSTLIFDIELLEVVK